MELNEAYSNLYITKEEQRSVEDYMGHQHTSMNILCNLDPELYIALKNMGWQVPQSKENIQKMINDFVNIYSVMYKNSKNYTGGQLIRGMSKSHVPNQGQEFQQFVSTSKNEEIAKTFTEYGNGAMVKIKLGGNVPYLDVAEYKDENSKDEEEVILAPFSRVFSQRKISNGATPYECDYYEITISAPQFSTIPKEELESLKIDVIDGFVDNIKDIKEYINFRDEIEILEMRYQREDDYMEKQDIAQAKLDKMDKFFEISKKVKDFKNKTQTLLKGLCREKEKEIDEAREIVQKDKERREEERKKQIEEERKRKEELERVSKYNELIEKIEQNPQNLELLNCQVTEAYKKIQDIENTFLNASKNLDVPFTNSTINANINKLMAGINELIEKTPEVIDELQESLNQDNSFEEITEKSIKYGSLMDAIALATQMEMSLNDIAENYGKQSEQNLKKNLYEKVQKTISEAKIQKYQQEKQEIQNERIGLFGRFTGKKDLQAQRLENIDLKIELERLKKPETKSEYSIHDMLADICVCSATELENNYTPEMSDLYEKIKQVYNPIKDEDVQKIAQKKIENQRVNMPQIQQTQKRFFGRNKDQIYYMQLQNNQLKCEISQEYQKGYMDMYVQAQPDYIAGFEQGLKGIYQGIDRNFRYTTDKPLENQVTHEFM